MGGVKGEGVDGGEEAMHEDDFLYRCKDVRPVYVKLLFTCE